MLRGPDCYRNTHVEKNHAGRKKKKKEEIRGKKKKTLSLSEILLTLTLPKLKHMIREAVTHSLLTRESRKRPKGQFFHCLPPINGVAQICVGYD